MAIDFQELKDYLPTYATAYLQPSPKAGPRSYVCPFCSSGTGPSQTSAFRLEDRERWHCHKCGEHGDIVDLHSHLQGLSTSEAVNELARLYNVRIREDYPVSVLQAVPRTAGTAVLQPTPSVPAEPLHPVPPQDYSPWLSALADAPLSSSPAAVTYLAAHGLTVEQAQGRVLLWDGNPRAASAWRREWGAALAVPSLVFPYPGGVYWHARQLQTEPRWKKPRGSEPLLGSESLPEVGAVFVVEGIADAFVLQAAGRHVLCLGGKGTAKAVEILSQEAYSGLIVVEATDRDTDGRSAARSLSQGLDRPVLSLWEHVEGLEDLEQVKDVADLAARSWQGLERALDRIPATEEDRLRLDSVGERLDGFLDAIRAQDATETLSTGFPAIDKALDGGLHPGFYILGALSSLGKTTLALQIADHIAATDQRDVLVISLEQGHSELVAKSLSRLTRALSDERRRGALVSRDISTHSNWDRWTEPQRERFAQALEMYRAGSRRLWIKDGIGDIGVSQIRTFVESHTRVRGQAPFIVVDYLQILAPFNERATDKMNTDRAVTELKRLSRDYQTPVLAISSLNRGAYSGPVTMEAFKESGAIEYGSDVLLGLQVMGLEDGHSDKDRVVNKRRVEDAKLNEVRGMELKVLKNRNGRTGTLVPLKFEAMYSYFETASADMHDRPRRTF